MAQISKQSKYLAGVAYRYGISKCALFLNPITLLQRKYRQSNYANGFCKEYKDFAIRIRFARQIKWLFFTAAALPGGYRNTDGTFNNVGNNGNWWSSTANDASNAWNRELNYNEAKVNRNNNNKANGFSVRCIRDLNLLVF